MSFGLANALGAGNMFVTTMAGARGITTAAPGAFALGIAQVAAYNQYAAAQMQFRSGTTTKIGILDTAGTVLRYGAGYTPSKDLSLVKELQADVDKWLPEL